MKPAMTVLAIAVLCWLPVGAPAAEAEAPAAADPGVYLADLARSLDLKWPANRTVNVVCHGHSVPAGYFKTPTVDTFNAYPHLLHVELKKRYPCAVVNVIVTAIGGEASPAGAERFERDVLSLRPALVTIDYSLNDRGAGLERAAAAWTSMIEKAKAKGVKAILLTPTPDKTARLDSPQDALSQHAEQVRALARKHGVGLADSLAAFRQRLAAGEKLDDFMSQVNHPSRKGHDLVVAELMKWFPAPAGPPGSGK